MSRFPRRLALRAGAVLTAAATAVLVTAAPAFAHVTAQPGTAEQGGYAVVTMRVPNESATAGTVKLEVSLPADTPFTSVRTTPIPGWTATLTTSPINPPVQVNGRTVTEAVTLVTFTAAPGTRIGPGEFLDFPISLGPMPTDRDSVSFPAKQTYDDGQVVAWDEPIPADGSEPAHPAPTVQLVPSSGAGHGHGGENAQAAANEPTDTTARWLGGVGLVVGALGLGVGAGALVRARKQGGGS
ncbi:Uncharacterized protein YcnI [Pseudonocardia thermophila]|jgi:Uncharacterized protein conserved in bacteria|uniref:Uncharacterized protein YcnI n=1 Tax=Pseudonocardia thermophila TaxID=1848 RepID=A0A1M6VC63_PSETH|nr:YcnI family protein [Pseudonocardia thermophila]SHK78945.1 Uncharacterized protein YcnI [Pseudonocardia thermophila]